MERMCPFKGCGKHLPAEKFACWPHWNALSVAQKREIRSAYEGWLKGEVTNEELRARQQLVLDEVEGAGG